MRKPRPVLIGSAVTSAVSLAVAFGLEVTPEQLAMVVAFVGTITALFVQNRVSPVVKG
jgi:uncharacterized membrane protein